MQHSAVETRVTLTSGELSIQEWGDPSSPTMICLHGWLDNSASFHRLAPLLSPAFHLLVVDLPGHGLSQPLADGAHYYIWQNIETLYELLVIKEIENVHLLGHSMGGVVASLFAGAFADKVQSLILLDSLGPMTSQAKETPKQLAKAVLDSQRTPSALRVFPNIADALQARKRSSPGMSDGALLPIVERNLKQSVSGYSWRTDARLRHTSKVRLTDEQVMAFLEAITAPVLVIMAEQGIVPESWVNQRMAGLKNAQLVYVSGHHHFHTESSGAEAISRHIINA